MTWRFRLVRLIFIVWFLCLAARLFYWQVVKGQDLRHQAETQYSSAAILPAARGQILASDGFPLVTNEDRYLLTLDLKIFPADTATAEAFLGLLPTSSSAQLRLQTAKSHGLNWFNVAHELSYSTRVKLEQLHLPGSYFELEPVRVYPEGSSSAYLTGFVGNDQTGSSRGYFGLEGFYDRLLSGKPGKLLEQHDAFNRPIIIGEHLRISPQNGDDLDTSIDRTVSYLALKHLSSGLQKYRAASGTVTIMDSSTGHILAMISLPGYDPSARQDFAPEFYKNPIISDAYEPGSTFKVIVMASALDAQVLTPDTRCDICTGPVEISGQKIGSWDSKYYPQSNLFDIILHSDNVGMVFVSRRLGRSKMLDYIRRFGFGRLSGIDLQEESTPEMRPDNDWQELDWATAAFGQGIAVTRLQMVAAVNTLANRGLYYAPRVVTALNHSPLPATAPKRIISSLAASQVTQMMINGVRQGEVRYYRPRGYLIAGKTGTAQIPIAGHYDPQKTIASFIGFAPADNPKFTMLVTLQNPQSSPWGSTTAAPLWFDIARDLFQYYRIPAQTEL